MVDKIPDWIRAELFEDALREIVEGYLKVRSFKAEPGSAAGDNYATIIVRVNIEAELKDGDIKEVSFLMKLPHQLEQYQMMKHMNIFEAERTMYTDIVPEMEALYKEAGVTIAFGAKSYDIKNSQSEYIALEDLSIRGFKNANRLEGLDQNHTERVLQKLAQWHAASAVRVSTEGPYPEILLHGFFKEENRAMVNEMKKGMGQTYLKCCATYEGNELYLEKIKALHPVVIDEMYKLAKVDPTDFNVLNHGDFWSNNIMFQYTEEGKVNEVYFVDYQVPKYGTVAQDLFYFLISSTKFEDKLSKFDHYVKVYHDSLVEHLKILKYSKRIPSLREIHMTLFKYGLFAYSVATGVMAVVLVDPTDKASFENFMGESSEGMDFQTQMYNNSRYRKHIEALMPWLLNRGALEITQN